jgi:hypothetical protein
MVEAIRALTVPVLIALLAAFVVTGWRLIGARASRALKSCATRSFSALPDSRHG